jgi:hypothetical protein
MNARPPGLLWPPERRHDDAERRARAELDAGHWDARAARWYVLAHEALAADAHRAWRRAGSPRRRAGERALVEFLKTW